MPEYKKTEWVNDETPLDAEHLNKIENGIYENAQRLTGLEEKLTKQQDAVKADGEELSTTSKTVYGAINEVKASADKTAAGLSEYKERADSRLAEGESASEANKVAIADEAIRAKEAESELSQKDSALDDEIHANTAAINAEQTRALDAESRLRQNIEENKKAADEAVKDGNKAFEEKTGDLQAQITKLKKQQNLADVVDTSADLTALNTADYEAGDAVLVLHDGAKGADDATGTAVIYRWDGTVFNKTGIVGDSYTKGEIDAKNAAADGRISRLSEKISSEAAVREKADDEIREIAKDARATANEAARNAQAKLTAGTNISDADLKNNRISVTVDGKLDENSSNLVPNRIIASAINGKQDALDAKQMQAVNSGITASRADKIETLVNDVGDRGKLPDKYGNLPSVSETAHNHTTEYGRVTPDYSLSAHIWMHTLELSKIEKDAGQLNHDLSEAKAQLNEKIDAEAERAAEKENEIDEKLENEISRATKREDSIDSDLQAEKTRATEKDASLEAGLTAEIKRSAGKDDAFETRLSDEETRAKKAEAELSDQISTINAGQNFVDTFATKADMTKFQSSGKIGNLQEGDCVLVLQDETHDGQSYVYRWTLTVFEGIGQLGTSYTKAQVDDLIDGVKNGSEELKGRVETLEAKADADEAAIAENKANIAKNADGLAKETERAEAAEQSNLDRIKAEETARQEYAAKTDGRLDGLEAYETQAKQDYSNLKAELSAESTRAVNAETALTDGLAAETARAKAAEKENGDAIAINKAGIQANADGIQANKTAIAVNKTSIGDLSALPTENKNSLVSALTEVAAGKDAVDSALKAETGRAKAKEGELEKALTDEATAARAAEKANSDAIAENAAGIAGNKAAVESEATDRKAADEELKKETESLRKTRNFADAYKTKADLLTADGAALNAENKVLVQSDESHDGQAAVYKWDGSEFDFAGLLGDSYTRKEIDAKAAASDEAAKKNASDIAANQAKIEELEGKTGDISKGLTDEISRAEAAESENARSIESEASDRKAADDELAAKLKQLSDAQNFAAVADSYADLSGVDTSGLDTKDQALVLKDETHGGQSAVYRWSGGDWLFVGSLGSSYTKEEVDGIQQALTAAVAENTSDIAANASAIAALQSKATETEAALGEETSDRKAADEAFDKKISDNAEAISGLKDGAAALEGRVTASEKSIEETAAAAAKETADRTDGDEKLQKQIDSINASQNFAETVGGYADLSGLDVSGLDTKDCVLVLQDEKNSGQSAVYRWNGKEFVLVGTLGSSYTKAEVDAAVNAIGVRVTANESTLLALRGELTSLDGRVTALEAKATETAEGISSNASDIKTLTDRADALEASLSTASKSIASAAEDIANEADRAKKAEQANADAIASEAATRTSTDNTLQTAIDTEASRATQRENEINGLLRDESTRATSKEAALDKRIDDLTASSQTALSDYKALNDAKVQKNADGIADLRSKLADETTARSSADAGLSERIDANASGVSTNSADIAAAKLRIDANEAGIESEKAARETADAELSSRANALEEELAKYSWSQDTMNLDD